MLGFETKTLIFGYREDKIMDLVNKFLSSLKAALSTDELEALNKAYGAAKEDIDILRTKYPNCPESLISLLENIDGTYWRKYGENEVTVCILGSDVEEYPYYLLSTQEMIESSKEGEDVSYLLEYQYDEDAVDSR